MIKITIYKNQEDEYVGFQCDGHAGCGESGEDVVCSAVSILVLNTINAIEQYAYDKFKCDASDERTGYIEFMFYSEPSAEATLLIDTMVLGLTSIRDDCEGGEDYLSISFKEV